MTTDKHDKQTRALPLERRGRPAKGDRAMTAAERQAAYRERMKLKGYKQASVFVPGCMLPGDVLAACREWLVGKTALIEVREDGPDYPTALLHTDREISECEQDLHRQFGDEWDSHYYIGEILPDMLPEVDER